MYYLFERCTFPMRDAASPECGCCVSLWRCGISTGDLQNSGYVTLLDKISETKLSSAVTIRMNNQPFFT
jgi:hypothetical protein